MKFDDLSPEAQTVALEEVENLILDEFGEDCDDDLLSPSYLRGEARLLDWDEDFLTA